MTRNRVRAVAWMLLFLAATLGAAALEAQRGAGNRRGQLRVRDAVSWAIRH